MSADCSTCVYWSSFGCAQADQDTGEILHHRGRPKDKCEDYLRVNMIEC